MGLDLTKENYGGKSKRTGTVRMPSEMLEAIDKFLESDLAKSRGFRFKSDVVTAATREFFDKYSYKGPVGQGGC